MQHSCPKCAVKPDEPSAGRRIVRHGGFYRRSDSRSIERYRCLDCRATFSDATFDVCFRQKKRQKNRELFKLLASGVTQRRSARHLNINRTTVARRLVHFGAICKTELALQTAESKVFEMEFDDLETFEHTKCKPISVILAVEAKTRRLLAFRAASMGAKGPLAEKAKKKYGFRKDERSERRIELFKELAPVVQPGSIIRSDSNPYYPKDVRAFFPTCKHVRIMGSRSATTGQGELKKVGFDPIFSLNHTCAMLRANMSRLIRKTWSTTKKMACLEHHLAIYAVYHNRNLKPVAPEIPIPTKTVVP